MKTAIVLVLLSSSACLLPPQKLTSPCVDKSVTDAGDMCPTCVTDGDCYVLSNACQEAAACVHRTSNWAVTLEGCSVEHPPPVATCGCVEGVCQSN